MTEHHESQARAGASGETGTPAPESFEAAMSELEGIVEGLERGELSLDDSVAAFQRGTRLVKYLTTQLDAAEKRVKVLIERAGETLEEQDLDEESH